MKNTHCYGWLMDIVRIANTVENYGGWDMNDLNIHSARDYAECADELHKLPMVIEYAEGE